MDRDDALAPLLGQLRGELAAIDVPTERIEVRATYTGEPDCTCGVCGDPKEFRETNVVDPEQFDYDDWTTEAVHEMHQPLDQQRLCRECEYQFVQHGGTFPADYLAAIGGGD